jgi:hypothetical protein
MIARVEIEHGELSRQATSAAGQVSLHVGERVHPAVRSHAAETGAVIVTKDEDFAVRRILLEGPPVVWVRIGTLGTRGARNCCAASRRISPRSDRRASQVKRLLRSRDDGRRPRDRARVAVVAPRGFVA